MVSGTPVPEPLRGEMLQRAAALRRDIDALVEAFWLEPQTREASRLLEAAFSVRWSDLEDTRPDRLRRYGLLAPESERVLGGTVDRMCRHLRALIALARST